MANKKQPPAEAFATPKNITEAYAKLDMLLAQADSGFDAVKSEDDMIIYHHTLGQWIRNNWGFWAAEPSPLKDWFKSMGYDHADNMSGDLLRGYWCYVHNKDFVFKGRK